MKLNLLLFLGIIVGLATGSAAQSTALQNLSGANASIRLEGLEMSLARYLESDDDGATAPGRPRVVDAKTSGFSASVIANVASAEHSAFNLINQKRLENGLKPLAWSDALANIARQHSQNMAEFKFFSHRGVDNKMVSDRADNEHLGKWRAIGENIAFNRGYQDPVGKAVELWLDSPSHRHNLMDDNWKESAIGVAVAPDGSYYFTQVFLLRK